jgi:peptidoglycan/LPS O-acetylase OafA/YrhL
LTDSVLAANGSQTTKARRVTGAPPADEPGSGTAEQRSGVLDGVRAVAIISVLLFHAGATWLPGGFLGVDVFFVLSGFLITSILLRELRESGRISFRDFYAARARRLLPGLVLVLAATSVLASTVARDAAARVRGDLLGVLTYTANWSDIAHQQSYFEATGRPALLQHLWSLAVEEQFYLICPAVLLFAWMRWGRRGVGWIALAGAVSSTTLMTCLSVVRDEPVMHDASRLYFGTDTHSMGLLIGCALAAVGQPRELAAARSVRTTDAGRVVVGGAAWLALIALAASMVVTDSDSALLYRGGFLGVAMLTAALIVLSSQPGPGVGRVLSAAPMRYVGTRSYGIYLWHWPIFMVTRTGIDNGLSGTTNLLLRLGLTLGAAELSYRFVELPIRRGLLGRAWTSWRARGASRAGAKAAGLLVLAGGLVVALIAVPLMTASAPSLETELAGRTGLGDSRLIPVSPATTTSAGSTAPSPTPTTSPRTAAPSATPRSGTGVPTSFATMPITAVGDSIMLGAARALRAAFPHITIDAHISRQPIVIFDRIRERKAAGQLGPVVVIHAGSNGVARFGDLMSILQFLSDRSLVLLINTHVPDPWGPTSNINIAAAAKHFKNVRVLDWATLSAHHRDWFYADATHTDPTGATHYADAIKAALRG